jgi:prepilin-type N-terminal cleavage/methylation domain-containing protein
MRTQRGFTLIELSVVTGIILILLGFITINLVRSQQSVSLNSVEQVLLADLKQQQLKSMIGDTEGRAISDSYGIHFDSDKYVLFHGAYSTEDPANSTVELDENFKFDFPEANIIFQKISGEISADSVLNVVLEDSTNENHKTIIINKYGVVTQVE